MEQESQKQLYEIVYLISPSLMEGEALDFHQKIKNEAQSLGAIMEEEGKTEKIRLSYPIKKQLEAHLGSFKFVLDPTKIQELNSKVKAENQMLRLICVKTVRPQQRQIITKPFRQVPEIKPAQNWSPASIEKETPAISVEEIDKKLEEILGK